MRDTTTSKPFLDSLGYALPYSQQATFLSLPMRLRALIINATFPAWILNERYPHMCSKRYLCPVLEPTLRPLLHHGLVCREWQESVIQICLSLIFRLWASMSPEQLEFRAFLRRGTLVDRRVIQSEIGLCR
jgi:hypothetical protein